MRKQCEDPTGVSRSPDGACRSVEAVLAAGSLDGSGLLAVASGQEGLSLSQRIAKFSAFLPHGSPISSYFRLSTTSWLASLPLLTGGYLVRGRDCITHTLPEWHWGGACS